MVPSQFDVDRVVERFDVDGVACMIAVGGAVCGYVRLDASHPWRRSPPVGAPVPLSYGPDVDGWVGFDTLGPPAFWERNDVPEPLRTELDRRDRLFAEAGFDDFDTLLSTIAGSRRDVWDMVRMRTTVVELARASIAAARSDRVAGVDPSR